NPESNGTEEEIKNGLDKMAQQVRQAQAGAASDNAKQQSRQNSGDQTAALGALDRFRSRIESLAGRDSNGRPGQQGQQPGRNGNQQGQGGGQQQQANGQRGQNGQQQGQGGQQGGGQQSGKQAGGRQSGGQQNAQAGNGGGFGVANSSSGDLGNSTNRGGG